MLIENYLMEPIYEYVANSVSKVFSHAMRTSSLNLEVFRVNFLIVVDLDIAISHSSLIKTRRRSRLVSLNKPVYEACHKLRS